MLTRLIVVPFNMTITEEAEMHHENPHHRLKNNKELGDKLDH